MVNNSYFLIESMIALSKEVGSVRVSILLTQSHKLFRGESHKLCNCS